jgi:hypothetical protein
VQFFILLYRLDAEERYLIWISDKNDSIAVDAEGFVPSFANTTGLRAYADRNHYTLEREEPILHDLDWVACWTKSPVQQIDCEKALAAWNLFSDIARSAPERGVAFQRLDMSIRPSIRRCSGEPTLPH